MTVYYQHVGEQMAARDFPVSLGSPTTGLKGFRLAELEANLQHVDTAEFSAMKTKLSDRPFQIWGLPAGAERVVARMTTDDFLILLESVDFQYCGRILHRVSKFSHELSRQVWGEQRFPIIVFLDGDLISYEWRDFLSDLGFAGNYRLRGTTMSIGGDRIAASRFKTEGAFIDHVLSFKDKKFNPTRLK